MGRVYTFTCPRCGYLARVSGGQEEGFHCVTQTIVCSDCRSLHDVAVRVRVVEAAVGSPQSAGFPSQDDFLPPMLLFGQPPRTKWLSFPLRCPKSGTHRVEAWTGSGKCPRCKGLLEREVLPYRIWD